MAYLSEENTQMYRRMLSADTEQGLGTSSIVSPPKIISPGVTQPPKFVPTNLPGKNIVSTTKGPLIGKDVVSPKPQTLVQAVYTPPTTTTEGRKFMPLVLLGGAGLLLYFLFKK
jgi:hypothetical protein